MTTGYIFPTDRFEIRPEHLALLKGLNWDFDECEFGAARIDPKRPYGNSGWNEILARIADDTRPGWRGPLGNDEDREAEWLEGHEGELGKVWRELPTVLEICTQRLAFEAGVYESQRYSREWRRVEG